MGNRWRGRGKVLKALGDAVTGQKALFELIAPKAGVVAASDGSLTEARHMIDGGPSVLSDTMALLTSSAAMGDLVNEAAARDFVTDAFQHRKFIGYDLSALTVAGKSSDR